MLRRFIAVAVTATIANVAATPAAAQSFAREGARPAESTALSSLSADEHMALARRAIESGDFDLARRQYVIAVSLEKDAGRLPVTSSFGLTQVLYALSYGREAAMVMDRLADAAAEQGNFDVEARARADALWLKHENGQIQFARQDARRLRELMKGNALSEETRKLVQTRVR